MTSRSNASPVVVVCGPTGVGKTAVAISLAAAFTGEIVGADSMQIYRFMDIGTAKPTPEEQARIPHHMIDIISPDVPYDAAQYEKTARKIIDDLYVRDKLPIVAGGTGFYIKALTQGLFDSLPTDETVRQRLREEAESTGSAALHARLAACDPASCARLHPNDTYRILRALEVFETTGIPLSAHHREHQFQDRPFRSLKIGLTMPRNALYERIDARVDNMISEGLLDEVRMLMEKGYPPSLNAMQSIGYRHMTDYIEGRLPWDEAVRIMKRDTRRYAKRQLTWFQADPEVRWHTPDQLTEIKRLIDIFLAE